MIVPTLADLLKLKYLLWQRTRPTIKSTLITTMGSRLESIQSMDQLLRIRLHNTDYSVIRSLYDSLRGQERKHHKFEVQVRKSIIVKLKADLRNFNRM